MRRSFRVATIFTGAAALAGGYGSTALAAATTPATAVHPDITWHVCGANNNNVSHWVHLYYVNNDHPAECFGYKGAHNANASITAFCPGNNIGSIFGSAGGLGGEGSRWRYGPEGSGKAPVSKWDYTHINLFHIDSVSISYWSGSSKCPAA